MSSIYTESELKEEQKYTIQDITKLSRDTKRFIGLTATFKYVNNSTAHVRVTGNMQTVPVRALIDVKGFIAKGVQSENADGFAVVSQNNLGIPVGRAYLGPDHVTDTHAVFTIDGKSIKLPLDILASLVRIKEKVPKAVKKAAKKSGVPVEVTGLLDSPELREDITEIPSAILKMLPHLNHQDIRDGLRKQPGIYTDYLNEVHETLEEVDRANTLIRHKMHEELLLKLVEEDLRAGFEQARSEAVKK